MRAILSMAICLGPTALSTSVQAYAPNGPVWVTVHQCNSYLNRMRIANTRGEHWDVVARFETAYCVELEKGYVVLVFPI